jgi:hypothetical protein
MQSGCFPDGSLGEVFLDAAKQNSALVGVIVDRLDEEGRRHRGAGGVDD